MNMKSINTQLGKLFVSESQHPNYPGFFIWLDTGETMLDLAYVEYTEEEDRFVEYTEEEDRFEKCPRIQVFVWGNPRCEEYSHRFIIKKDDIAEIEGI